MRRGRRRRRKEEEGGGRRRKDEEGGDDDDDDDDDGEQGAEKSRTIPRLGVQVKFDLSGLTPNNGRFGRFADTFSHFLLEHRSSSQLVGDGAGGHKVAELKRV